MILDNYFKQAIFKIRDSINKSHSDIIDLSDFMAEIMLKNGIIHLFGVGHDRSLGMELGFRAGGLVQYHQMSVDDVYLRNEDETIPLDNEEFLNREGLAIDLWELYEIEKQDALIIYVVNDVYRVTVDLAKLAKEKGHPVILITSKENILAGYSEDNAKELLALADKSLDLHIDNPDIFFDVNDVKVTQIANLVGNMYAQSLTMEIYKYMKSKSKEAPVLWSMNIKGADEHNKLLTEAFDGRWNS